MQRRRAVLRNAMVAASVGLVGCSGGDGGEGTGTGTLSESTFTDPCENVGNLSPKSDKTDLGVDNTNVEYFVHPDGSTDDVRYTRTGTTDDATIVYPLGGQLRSATAEFHWHQGEGGDIRLEASSDGGGTWTPVETSREEYGTVSGSWHHDEVSGEFSEGVDRCRFVLTAGNQPWSGQLGHVEISWLSDGSTASPFATPEPTPTPTPVPSMTPVDGSVEDVVFDHPVVRDGAGFAVDGEPAYFSGGNHPQVSRYDGGVSADALLSSWTDLVSGLNVMRVPAFGEGEDNYLQPAPGLFNEQAFKLLDRVVYQFGRHGVRLVMPLANYWDWRGGIPQYLDWIGADEKAAFYTDDQAIEWFHGFIEELLERDNTITGVKYKDDPTIMLWELANEPRVGTADYADYKSWVRSTAEFIKSIDDTHLVSTGMEGFYGPDGPVGHDPTRYVETHELDAIDACSYHLYPNAWGLSKDESVEWIENHTAKAHEEVGKPAYCGEFGWEVDRTDDTDDSTEIQERNAMFERWYQAFVEHETDAAMVWDLRADSEYEWTHTWNGHAIYPRDESTVELLDEYTRQILGLEAER